MNRTMSLPTVPSHLTSNNATRKLPFEMLGLGQFQDYRPWQLKVNCPFELIPTRSSSKAAGYDLYSGSKVIIQSHGSVLVNTRCKIELPSCHYGKIEGNTRLAVRHDIVSFGSVIDEDYSGEIHVKLFNMSVIPHIIHVGDCIAQLVVQPYANLNLSRGFEQ